MISLQDDFEVAKAKLDQLTQVARERHQPYVNPDFILYDPYLHTHNREVNTEYPNPVTNKEWEQIFKETRKNIYMYILAPEERKSVLESEWVNGVLDYQLNKKKKNPKIDKERIDDLIFFLNMTKIVPGLLRIHALDDKNQNHLPQIFRKRIKRLLDRLILQEKERDSEDDPNLVTYVRFGEIALEFIYCDVLSDIHNIEERLEFIENDLVYGDNGHMFTECKVSKIITNDKHQFIKQHKVFGYSRSGNAEDDQYAKCIPEMLLQRMRYALSLRGETYQVNAFHGLMRNLQYLSPARVMERYLNGEKYETVAKGEMQTFEFEARTPEKLTDLLYEAYERGIKKIYNQGETFSTQELVVFALADQKLKPLYEEFVTGLSDGEDIDSPYFKIIENKIKEGEEEKVEKGVGYKKEFFKYILERLGYVIDPQNPSVNILSDESQHELAEAKKKDEAASKETMDQLKALKEEIAAAKPKSASPQAQLKGVSLGDGNEREGYVREYYNAPDGLLATVRAYMAEQGKPMTSNWKDYDTLKKAAQARHPDLFPDKFFNPVEMLRAYIGKSYAEEIMKRMRRPFNPPKIEREASPARSPQAEVKGEALGNGNERERYVREYYNAPDGLLAAARAYMAEKGTPMTSNWKDYDTLKKAAQARHPDLFPDKFFNPVEMLRAYTSKPYAEEIMKRMGRPFNPSEEI